MFLNILKVKVKLQENFYSFVSLVAPTPMSVLILGCKPERVRNM